MTDRPDPGCELRPEWSGASIRVASAERITEQQLRCPARPCVGEPLMRSCLDEACHHLRHL